MVYQFLIAITDNFNCHHIYSIPTKSQPFIEQELYLTSATTLNI